MTPAALWKRLKLLFQIRFDTSDTHVPIGSITSVSWTHILNRTWDYAIMAQSVHFSRNISSIGWRLSVCYGV
jgi:hypothetical protein